MLEYFYCNNCDGETKTSIMINEREHKRESVSDKIQIEIAPLYTNPRWAE